MSQSSLQMFAKILSTLLVLMYAFVPYILDSLKIYQIPWAVENFYYSVVLAVIIMFLPHYSFKKHLFRFDVHSNSLTKTIVLFFVCCLVFSLWSWHDDRESVGASVAAFFRALWILNSFCFIKSTEKKRTWLILLTAILVFIDQSRTYFMISFMVLALASNRKKLYLVIGMFGVLLVAAVRVGESMSIIGMLTYGIVGEGYNGSKAVGQVLLLNRDSVDWLSHTALTLLQPIYLPIEMVVGPFFDAGLPTQSSILGNAVKVELGEKLSPMGGWYILADFIWYGPIGIVLMFIYINMTWYLSNFILNTRYFPIGAFFFFLSIKAMPFVYYKMLTYVVGIAFVFTLLGFYKNKNFKFRPVKIGNLTF
ncbi:hypothetical protein [Paraglaciecola sp. 20A4]|uniref:hypothetical protein n=1 Tax=Paraglaciecola sp. 20A4 TaxID=2687288 RepID=UPI0014080DB7|nr:hypothetical protein [Paraglaciecola sp. 20A4]